MPDKHTAPNGRTASKRESSSTSSSESSTAPARPEQPTPTGEPRTVVVIEDEATAARVLPVVPINDTERADIRVNDEADLEQVRRTTTDGSAGEAAVVVGYSERPPDP